MSRKKRETRLSKRLENLENSLPKSVKGSAYFLVNNIDNDTNLRIYEERTEQILSETTKKRQRVMSNIRLAQRKDLLEDTNEEERIKLLENPVSSLTEKNMLYTSKDISHKYLVQVKYDVEDKEGNKETKTVHIKADSKKQFQDQLDNWLDVAENKYELRVLSSRVSNVYKNNLYRDELFTTEDF